MLIYGVIWSLAVGASLSAVAALTWWIDAGGLKNIDAQAREVFALSDDDVTVEDNSTKEISTQGN